MTRGGFAFQIPSPQLYYELLRTHRVMIHGRRGVKIRGLWYDGPGLDAHRDTASGRGGRHKDKWVVRSDPRDRRFVYFQDPDDRECWHELRWTGLPPVGEIPSFGDARVSELLAESRRTGLRPRTDEELLPLLLELVGGKIPVESWPTQMTRAQRAEHARELAQGAAAAADRPKRSATKPAAAGIPDRDSGNVVALRWPQRAEQAVDAVDAERRRRREQAVTARPAAPAGLGERLRRTSLLAVPADDDSEGGDLE